MGGHMKRQSGAMYQVQKRKQKAPSIYLSPCTSRHSHLHSATMRAALTLTISVLFSCHLFKHTQCFKASIVYRAPASSYNSSASEEDRFLQMLQADDARIWQIHTHIQTAITNKSGILEGSKGQLPSTMAPISSGLTLGSGEYFVRVGIGTPPRSFYMILDTGSDISWIQCSACNVCYSQVDQLYDPQTSSSYETLPCDHHLCQQLRRPDCLASSCSYSAAYLDNSKSLGKFSLETFWLGYALSSKVAFGCGHTNTGLFAGAAGLLGMGGGPLSFISQISSYVGRKFSYCLVRRESRAGVTSPLIFGGPSMPQGAFITPLVKNSISSTYYYGHLVGISVGGKLLPIPQSLFKIDASGDGGLILDSGTTITLLPNDAYAALRDEFRAQTSDLSRSSPKSVMDTCYDVPLESTKFPSVVLHYANSVDMVLPQPNVMIKYGGVTCLGFRGSALKISILGNLQQQGFRMAFDEDKLVIGIAPAQC